jgi:hypothetical protein
MQKRDQFGNLADRAKFDPKCSATAKRIRDRNAADKAVIARDRERRNLKAQNHIKENSQ